ncbi:Y-family DNA polymerase [Glaciecola siphonariae]|uniref:Y-family DNA polymerase n=1 Tax=Glaciecola siphonariae TaxID=521012 RepID=A0ABV9LW34_9ALTE
MQFDTRSLWIYLHFTQLQLDVIEHSQQGEAEVLHEPRAIYEARDNQIVQINKAAAERGIKLGMGLASASLLYSDLILHEYRPELESNTLEHLANALYLISSDIVLSAPNGLILRAQNMLNLYGGLAPYWQHIEQCLSQYKYHYHCASAFSIQAAKLIAKHGIGDITDEREHINNTLMKCSLERSDIDHKDLEKLKRIGILNMAELSRVPLSELANRMGRFSLAVISELRGQAPSKVSFFKPQTKYDDYIELLYEVSISDKLIPVLGHALNKLRDFLYVRNARCLHIDIDFYQREHAPMTIAFDSAMPIYQNKDWMSIIELKLESVKFQSPVYAIELHCHRYELAELAHDDFFARKSTHVAAMSLMSRLVSKLGKHKVSGLKFVNDFRPERNTCKPPPGNSDLHNDASIFADRPGLLLPQPLVLTQKVQVIKGPERIVSGWWENSQISRDYYIGQSEQGQQLWMFKTPEQTWYLHGYFV